MAEKTIFNTLKHVLTETKEQTVEAELQLPDYYPEVAQIIKCSAVPYGETVTVSGDRISIAGDLTVKLIFSGADKSINVFVSHQKYTKVLQTEQIDSKDSCFVRQFITSVNYRATGPRRIEVRAQISVKADVYRVFEQELIASAQETGIEQHLGNMECFNVSTVQKAFFEATDSLPLPGRKAGGVISEVSAAAVITEKKVIKNKVMLRGNCDIHYTLLYSETSKFERGSITMPFTGITEVFGIEETDDCVINVMCVNPEISLKESDNESEAANISAVIEAEIIGGKSMSVEYTDDAYSLNGSVSAECSEVLFTSCVKEVNENISVVAEAECYDEAISEVCGLFCDSLRYNTVSKDGFCCIEGCFLCNAVVKNQSGDIRLVTKSISFEKNLEISGNSSAFIDAFISSCRCVPADNSKLRINAEISVTGFYANQSNCRAAIKINTAEKNAAAAVHSENIALYYASKGESLWSIAKENRGRCEVIKKLNGITDDTIQENRVLVFPCGTC